MAKGGRAPGSAVRGAAASGTVHGASAGELFSTAVVAAGRSSFGSLDVLGGNPFMASWMKPSPQMPHVGRDPMASRMEVGSD